jgi:hypothetical protein
MFQRVIVVMPGGMEARDALVLGAQSANRDGVVVAANVLASEPAPTRSSSARTPSREAARHRSSWPARHASCSSPRSGTASGGPPP